MEHTSIVSVTDGDLVPPGPRALSGCSRELVSPEALAFNIRSGCVYDAQPSETFGLLVTRSDPRTRRGTKHGRSQVRASIHAHWPLFAPSMQLLTGHDAPCHARRCHGVGRCADHMAHVPPVSGWPAFAAAYRAELEAWPFHLRLAVARQMAAWLRCVPTVTNLCFDSRVPAGSTADCWAQRHIFRDWVRSLLPLALPLGADHLGAAPGVTDEEGVVRGGASGSDA